MFLLTTICCCYVFHFKNTGRTRKHCPLQWPYRGVLGVYTPCPHPLSTHAPLPRYMLGYTPAQVHPGIYTLPPVDRQRWLKTLPCPKLHLWAVNIVLPLLQKKKKIAKKFAFVTLTMDTFLLPTEGCDDNPKYILAQDPINKATLRVTTKYLNTLCVIDTERYVQACTRIGHYIGKSFHCPSTIPRADRS